VSTIDETHLAWERVLDQLEAQTIEAEVLTRTLQPYEITPWALPELAGPLPAHLVGRAHTLLDRQQALLDQIPTVLGKVRQQSSVTTRFSEAMGRPRSSVYIDRSA
jgi:hypothetical protein